MTDWTRLWRERSAPPPPGAPTADPTARLMEADGLDSGFAGLTPERWLAGLRRITDEIGLPPDASVYEAGCGAGAFLHDLHARGHPVAGSDLAPRLIELARTVMPEGTFTVGEAADLDVTVRYDAVVSFGVFLYFPSRAYAEAVLDRMVRKARGIVAILDVPDAAREREDLARRQAQAGGAAAYAARYAGLEHRYYDRAWMRDALTARGLVDVRTATQDIEGYGNAPYRFNAWGRHRPA